MAFAQRAAINAPIQGGAADIIKLAMKKIHHTLKENAYKTKMLLQVHDELVFEAPVEEVEEISLLIKNIMEEVAHFDVDFLDKNSDELLAAIAAKDPQTALDVENFAIEVLISQLDSDIFNELKQWVYNSPSFKIEIQGQEQEYTVSMNDVCFILSLPLRDMYLKTHPDLE